jgi:hypothetical protein
VFNDQIECNEAIARGMIRSVHEPWEEICLETDLDGNSTNLVLIYRPAGDDEFSGNVIPDIKLAGYMFELSRLVSTPEKGFFKRCIFTVHSDGRYKADFTY